MSNRNPKYGRSEPLQLSLTQKALLQELPKAKRVVWVGEKVMLHKESNTLHFKPIERAWLEQIQVGYARIPFEYKEELQIEVPQPAPFKTQIIPIPPAPKRKPLPKAPVAPILKTFKPMEITPDLEAAVAKAEASFTSRTDLLQEQVQSASRQLVEVLYGEDKALIRRRADLLRAAVQEVTLEHQRLALLMERAASLLMVAKNL